MNRRFVRSALLAAGAAVLTLFLGAAPAMAAAPDPGAAATAMKSGGLYVDPAMNARVPDDSEQLLKETLAKADPPVYLAIVGPNEVTSPQQAQEFLKTVQQQVGTDGTYAGLFGNDMIALSDSIPTDKMNQLVSDAGSSGGSQTDKLVEFIGLVDEENGGSSDAASGGGSMAGSILIGVLVLGLIGGGFFLYRSRKQRMAREAEELAKVKNVAEEDVTRLGEDIAGLDIDLTRGDLDPDTRQDYTRAMDSYDRAKTSLEACTRPEQLQPVTQALEDGRYYMTATRARLSGDPVPERRAPCFFNPNHGPSIQDVMWAPPGGAPRSVPACAADAQAVLGGYDPDARMVEVGGGRRMPYYQAGPAYAPYAGGYYGGFGDMFGGMFAGMMIGSMLSGGFGFGGMGMGGDYGGGDAGGGGDWGGGGDFGGFGDFGGGDFGGGDF